MYKFLLPFLSKVKCFCHVSLNGVPKPLSFIALSKLDIKDYSYSQGFEIRVFIQVDKYQKIGIRHV